MSLLLSDLATGLRSIGAMPALVLWGGGLVGMIWSLYLWAKIPPSPWVERLAGWAVPLFGAGLLLRLGDSLMSPPTFQLWHWAVALVVLPWLVRLERVGGMAAMGVVLSLAAVMAGVSSWWLPIELTIGLAVVAGSTMLALAIVLDRLQPAQPPPPEPPPVVYEQALQQRLDSAEANEAADKDTRE